MGINLVIVIILLILIGVLSSKKFRNIVGIFYDNIFIWLWNILWVLGIFAIVATGIYWICIFIHDYYLKHEEHFLAYFWGYVIITGIVVPMYYLHKKNPY